MHFRDDVIAFIGPACAFALEPVARLAAYWNTPIITGMGDQVNDYNVHCGRHIHIHFYVRLQLMQEIDVRNGQLFFTDVDSSTIPYKCHLFKCTHYSKCLISQNDLILSDLIKWYALRVLRH